MQIVLLHSVDITNRLVFTGHAGILLKTTDGYTYIEKAGGCGPFVMLDVKDIDDLAIYYGTIVSSINQGHYNVSFLTVNDATIKPVPRQPIPLRNENGEIITGKPNRLAEIDP